MKPKYKVKRVNGIWTLEGKGVHFWCRDFKKIVETLEVLND